MPDMCRLDDSKICNDCGDCDICDIDASKTCDNCMKCVTGEQTFRSVVMVNPPDSTLTPDGKPTPRKSRPRPNV